MKRIRRDRFKIYMDILLIIREESKKDKLTLTRVQQRANVPFDRLKMYLLELKSLSLIQGESSPKLTEKGVEYVTECEKILDFMKRMGLTYS